MRYDADVVIINSLGPAFTEQTIKEEGIGGSELEVIQLAQALTNSSYSGLDVVVANRPPLSDVIRGGGLKYVPTIWPSGKRVRAAVAWRATAFPPQVFADVMAVRPTDVSSPYYDVHLQKTVSGEAGLVCVSEWQAKGFPFARRKAVIPPMLDPTPVTDFVPNRFVYASAISKGLPDTVEFWKHLKRKHVDFAPAELLIALPGKSGGSYELSEEDAEVFNISFAGATTVAEHRAAIASGHLFYVDTFQETFGCVAALAERSGRRAHVFAFHGRCGFAESVVDQRTVVTSPEEFERTVMEAWRGPSKYPSVADKVMDRSPEALVADWIEVLGLT